LTAAPQELAEFDKPIRLAHGIGAKSFATADVAQAFKKTAGEEP
jgi:hypothetical protein